jgi:hypothetical protein
MKVWKPLVVLALMALAAGAAPVGIAATKAKPVRIRLTGTYSNITYSDDGGDLLGEEIRLFYTGEGVLTALVQITDSTAGEAALEPITAKGNEVDLKFARPLSGVVRIRGRVTQSGFEGELFWASGKPEKIKLKRGKSYWD